MVNIMSQSEENITKKSSKKRRFFSSHPLPLEDHAVFTIKGKETLHMRQVLRMKIGSPCLVADSYGAEVEAEIVQFDNDEQVKMKVNRLLAKPLAPQSQSMNGRIIFYIGVPQRGKMDAIVEKAQEIGIHSIVPIHTEWTVARVEPAKQEKVLTRWRKIAAEAYKQSHAAQLTQVSAFLDFSQVLKNVPAGETGLIFHPGSQAESVHEWMIEHKTWKGLHCLIGPEGGFSEKEAAAAKDKGFQYLSLGKNLLKVDTAFILAAGMLRLVNSQ
jgi:16S rRNA (uracil1498-N3)-methyltransferase